MQSYRNINLLLPVELYRLLKYRSERMGKPYSVLVRAAIDNFLKNKTLIETTNIGNGCDN